MEVVIVAMKVTKKDLKEFGDTNGYWLANNVYTCENLVHQMYAVANYKDTSFFDKYYNNDATLVDRLLASDTASIELVAYSCGKYGNTGQLYLVRLFRENKDYDFDICDIFFVYWA